MYSLWWVFVNLCRRDRAANIAPTLALALPLERSRLGGAPLISLYMIAQVHVSVLPPKAGRLLALARMVSSWRCFALANGSDGAFGARASLTALLLTAPHKVLVNYHPFVLMV